MRSPDMLGAQEHLSPIPAIRQANMKGSSIRDAVPQQESYAVKLALCAATGDRELAAQILRQAEMPSESIYWCLEDDIPQLRPLVFDTRRNVSLSEQEVLPRRPI
ncbi:MAG: hypothetical protein KDD55_12360, partial [Bdellovibrionales bacterium]|nr:hypothetical protein [Bdellovibrionales bacterium]